MDQLQLLEYVIVNEQCVAGRSAQITTERSLLSLVDCTRTKNIIKILHYCCGEHYGYLEIAIKHGDLSAVKELSYLHYSLTNRLPCGIDPIDLAIQHKHQHIVIYIIDCIGIKTLNPEIVQLIHEHDLSDVIKYIRDNSHA